MKCFWNVTSFLNVSKEDQMQMHSFMLTETFQKHFINACPWVNPIPIYGHTCPWVYPHLQGAQLSTPWIPTPFLGGKLHPLAERAFNFPNMPSFETKSKTDIKTFQKHFRNVPCMTMQVAKLTFPMRWPWPWPNDLDTQTWPRNGQDVTSYQKWSFYVNSFKSYSMNRHTDTQTHRQTNTMKTLPLPHTREVKTKMLARRYFFVIKSYMIVKERTR